MNCRICEGPFKDETLFIKEKMYSINMTFEYLVCGTCNCIQIKNIPDDLSKYYPENYYSFITVEKNKFRKKIKQTYWNFLSNLLNKFNKKPDFTKFGIKGEHRNKGILDIGCGEGKLLKELKKYGYRKLTGVDPFLNRSYKKRGLELLKTELNNVKGRFDLILSFHSLEHMPDPHAFFKNVKRLLKINGELILRIPIYPNYIWDEYGVDWIQLDAPRHLYTFHLDTIRYLCERYNLEITGIIDDSDSWALASTKYCLNGESHTSFAKIFRQNETNICEHLSGLKKNVGDTAQITMRNKND